MSIMWEDNEPRKTTTPVSYMPAGKHTGTYEIDDKGELKPDTEEPIWDGR